MSGFLEGIGKFIGDAARYAATGMTATQAIGDLMGMSESEGMEYLSEIIPSIVENGHIDNFIFLLNLRAKDEHEDRGIRVKATRFRMEAERLARSIE